MRNDEVDALKPLNFSNKIGELNQIKIFLQNQKMV